jgi:hypothetical protein
MDEWMYDNAEMIGFAIVAIILWLVADRIRFVRRQLRKNERGRLINTLRGALMSKKDSDKFFMMRFEDALENEFQELKWEGRMTEAQEREYRAFFADFGLIGLYPMRDVKRGIQQRLKKMYNGKRPLEFLNGKLPKPVKEATPVKKATKYVSNSEGA